MFFGGRDAVVEARQERRKLSFLNSCRQNLYQSHDTKAESLEDVFKTAWSIQVLEELMNCSFSREKKRGKKKRRKAKAGARGPYADFLSSRLCDSKGKKLLPLIFCYSFITCACGRKAGWY